MKTVIALSCASLFTMGCVECEAPQFDLYCGQYGESPAADGTVTALFTLKSAYIEEWKAQPTPDFGCHFRTDGPELELVPDGQMCFVRAESYFADPDFFTRSCVPPVGTWLMANGVRTRKVEVFENGRMRCTE
ncbi:MAG: hypothetical protein U0228_03630 [Myxococcaceae bacterium]